MKKTMILPIILAAGLGFGLVFDSKAKLPVVDLAIGAKEIATEGAKTEGPSAAAQGLRDFMDSVNVFFKEMGKKEDEKPDIKKLIAAAIKSNAAALKIGSDARKISKPIAKVFGSLSRMIKIQKIGDKDAEEFWYDFLSLGSTALEKIADLLMKLVAWIDKDQAAIYVLENKLKEMEDEVAKIDLEGLKIPESPVEKEEKEVIAE